MAILGPVTTAALRRFEADDLVEQVHVHHDRIRVAYATGIREVWGLLGEKPRRLTLPTSGWRRRMPLEGLEFSTFWQLDLDYEPDNDIFFMLTGRDLRHAGFLERRLVVHRAVTRLLREGWIKPNFPNEALDDDLAALRTDPRRFVVTPGYVRGQPGRATSPPPGLVLANHLVDWGPLAGPGRIALRDAWSDPRRLYWAVSALVEKGRDVVRAGIIHRLVCGTAMGFPVKAGPRWESPALCRSILQYLLGLGHRPVVLDLDPGCGSLAVATASLGGVYIASSIEAFAPEGIEWAGSIGASIIADDSEVTADVVFVNVVDVEDLVEQVRKLGWRCATVVGELPDGPGVRDALPGADVIRLRPRPFRKDKILVVWRQA